jgi:hypothetical protein
MECQSVDTPDDVELDVPTKGEKIDALIGYPCDVMAARVYDPA